MKGIKPLPSKEAKRILAKRISYRKERKARIIFISTIFTMFLIIFIVAANIY